MTSTNDTQRSFRLPTELDSLLVEKAEELDRSVSWVILRCLEAQLLPGGEEETLERARTRGLPERD
jgi:predicted transcriptional regulator